MLISTVSQNDIEEEWGGRTRWVGVLVKIANCNINVTRPQFSVQRLDVIFHKLGLRVSSGFPNTRKLMKARHRRPSAFIVFECLETLMKLKARVYEMASQKGLIY